MKPYDVQSYDVDLFVASANHSAMVSTNDVDKAKTPDLVAFGEAVRARRKERGYSQEAFGDHCGINRSYMGGIERGAHNLALINILKIIRALEMEPSEFFKALDANSEKE